MENYRKLCMGNKQFEIQYGIKKQDLLEMYNYEKDMEEKHGRII